MTTKRHSIFGPQVEDFLLPSSERKAHFHLVFCLSQPVNRSIWVSQKTMCHNCFANWMFCVDRKTLILPIGRRKHGKGNLSMVATRIITTLVRSFSWVRFEEIAETVLGRWSKPHVATLMQTALLDLKSLLGQGVILLNVTATDLPDLSRTYREGAEQLRRVRFSSSRNDCSRFIRCSVHRRFRSSSEIGLDSWLAAFSSSRKTVRHENGQFD